MQQRINPLTDIAKLQKEPQSFWLEILDKYFVNNTSLSVQCVPSIQEQQTMAKEEKDRIALQIQKLTEDGLKEKGEILEKAIEFNEREPPGDMITSVPIPSLNSIRFHNITRFKSDAEPNQKINLSVAPVFTYFDHLKTNFVYVSTVSCYIIFHDQIY